MARLLPCGKTCIFLPYVTALNYFAKSLSKGLSVAKIQMTMDLSTRWDEGSQLKELQISMYYQPVRGNAEAIGLCEVHTADCVEVLSEIPDGSIDLIVTSPPYNVGKPYETRSALDTYVDFQTTVIEECYRVLSANGSICWQVGNWVDTSEVIPLDSIFIPILRRLGMKIRSRVVWTFGHGLHCTKRFSGRHETIVWATKSGQYHFDLDSVRVPQKYPNKRHYKGPNIGQLSGNPLGKNPGDVWEISNVVMSLSKPGQTVLDPFAGSGTVGAVCNRLDRRSVLIERAPEYVNIIRDRLGGSKPPSRMQLNEEGVALEPSIDDLVSLDQTSTVNPGSNPVASPGYPLAFETILVEPTT